MSTSKLQRQVKKRIYNYFFYHHIYENYRPKWLQHPDGSRLELDFYIEELRIAIEVQGEQHFVYVPFFHKDYDSFLLAKKRDEYKKKVCRSKGIKFIELLTESQIEYCIDRILAIEGKPKDKRQIIAYMPFDLIKTFPLKKQCYTHFNASITLYEETVSLKTKYKGIDSHIPERLKAKRTIEDKLYRLSCHKDRLKDLKKETVLASELLKNLNDAGVFGIFKISKNNKNNKFRPRRLK